MAYLLKNTLDNNNNNNGNNSNNNNINLSAQVGLANPA